VKPGNILIGTDGCAKVADFGIAKSLEVAGAADLTSTNQLVGTPAYVAPERINGDPATPQTDLYALGVVLYEAFAGKKPFTGSTPVATAYAIRHETPVALRELRPDLPPPLVAAIEKAMARDPGHRFASAAAMAAALDVDGSSTAVGGATDATLVTPLPDATRVLATGPVATPIGQPLAPVAASRSPRPHRQLIASLKRTLEHPAIAERQRPLLIASVAALVVALLLLGVAAAAGGGNSQPNPREALAKDLRTTATGLDVSHDGRAAPEARNLLLPSADAVAATADGSRAQANAALHRLAGWRDEGKLTAPAVERIRAVLFRVPGVDQAAFTPPTTQAPPTFTGDAGKKKKKDGNNNDD
jgi:hypothetical protein